MLEEKGVEFKYSSKSQSFHFCVTNVHTKETIDELINDIKEINNILKIKKNNTSPSKSIYETTQK